MTGGGDDRDIPGDPSAGLLELLCRLLRSRLVDVDDRHVDPDQQLMLMTAEPDTPSHQALRFLGSWATNPNVPASDTVT